MKKKIIGLACLAITGVSLALAQETPSTESILLGTWSVKIGTYEDIWTFKEDGSAVSAKEPKNKATWKKEDNCILIQWSGVENGYKTWEAFTLPLKKDGTQGGNWGGAKVTAKKIE